MSKTLTQKQIDRVFDIIFYRMAEADFEKLVGKLQRVSDFKCLRKAQLRDEYGRTID